jgi:hypothetical protein
MHAECERNIHIVATLYMCSLKCVIYLFVIYVTTLSKGQIT